MQPLYKIKLQNFEGPLDLLLFFVRKDELNIYDIPLARITQSYLEYLQLMQDLDLDIAGEFILMAATLMRIKAASMLPPDPAADEDEDMMDPREELSRRLIEYRQFKEASKTLSELDEYWRTVYRRSYFNFDLLPPNLEEPVGLKDVSFFDLLTAYKNALAKRPKMVFHNIERINVTVEDQRKYIMSFFRDRTCYLFTELCEDMGKIEIVVTFLAMLELIRQAEIAARQASIFDDIWIYKASEFKEEEIPEAERAVPAEAIQTEIRSMTEPDTKDRDEPGSAAKADEFNASAEPHEEIKAAAHTDEIAPLANAESLTDVSGEATGHGESIPNIITDPMPPPIDDSGAALDGNTGTAEVAATTEPIAKNEPPETTEPVVEKEPASNSEPIVEARAIKPNETVLTYNAPPTHTEEPVREEIRPVVHTVVTSSESAETEKVSRIRSFFIRIVSIVKKIFS